MRELTLTKNISSLHPARPPQKKSTKTPPEELLCGDGGCSRQGKGVVSLIGKSICSTCGISVCTVYTHKRIVDIYLEPRKKFETEDVNL